ncbi:uncharacterized protein [Diadema setosum]|uniref:uncharacterized protein n=1 Tax=Diadema setosum TaxID=31175 RepID=UPI003B3A0FD3
MNSLGLTIFAVVAVVCLSTSAALPAGIDSGLLRQRKNMAALLDQLHNTYQNAVKRNFCADPFLDSLAEDFCMRRKRSGIPDEIADFVSRSRRETMEEAAAAAADQE